MTKRRGRIYHALNHPIRREIVKLLGFKERVGSTEFKDFLNIGPGKLYYHLENLGSLIEQDEDKRYRLSREGKEALRLLSTGEALPIRERKPPTGIPHFLQALKPIFTPGWLLSYLFENPTRHIPETIILVLIGGLLSYASGLQPLVLFYANQSQPLYLAMAQFLASWFAIYILSEGICHIIFNRREGKTSLLIGTGISLIPMMLYSTVWLLNSRLDWGMERFLGGWILRGLLLFFQGWALSVLSVSVSRAKKLSIDRASFTSLASAYLSIAVYIIIKGI